MARQWFINGILNIFGLLYLWVEKYKKYPDDREILGIDIDDDLYVMSREQLRGYMDSVLPQAGFYDLQSTTKIRLGCQLLKNLHLLKKSRG